MQSESEYNDWIRKFYEGSFLVGGWNDRIKDLTSGLDAEVAGEIKAGLDALGAVISKEWAKDNAVRTINTDHLQQWGGRLRDEKAKGAKDLLAAIGVITGEASALLPP